MAGSRFKSPNLRYLKLVVSVCDLVRGGAPSIRGGDGAQCYPLLSRWRTIEPVCREEEHV